MKGTLIGYLMIIAIILSLPFLTIEDKLWLSLLLSALYYAISNRGCNPKEYVQDITVLIVCIVILAVLLINLIYKIRMLGGSLTNFCSSLLASVMVSWIPGAMLLNVFIILDKKYRPDPLEYAVLSYIISMLISSLMGLMIRTIEVLAILRYVYLAIGMAFVITISGLFQRLLSNGGFKIRRWISSKTFYNILPLTIIILVFVGTLTLIYPTLLLNPLTSIAEDYSYAITYIYNPNANSQNAGYHLLLAIMWSLAGSPSISEFSIALVFLSLILPLSFYLLVRTISSNEKHALLATLLLLFAGGFGWLYLLFGAPVGSWNYAQINNDVYYRTNADIGKPLGLSLWYQYGSITINATVLLCLLYILYSERLHPFLRALILVTYPTILATYCIHGYAITPLVLISLILLGCIDVKDVKLMMIGYISSIIPYTILYSDPISALLTIFFVCMIMFLAYKIKEMGKELDFKERIGRQAYTIVNILVLYYVFSITYWIIKAKSTNLLIYLEYLNEMLIVPIHLYPVLLGLLGLLSILSLRDRELVNRREYISMITIALAAIILGKIITLLNITQRYSPLVHDILHAIGLMSNERYIMTIYVYPFLCVLVAKAIMGLAKRAEHLGKTIIVFLVLIMTILSTICTIYSSKENITLEKGKIELLNKLVANDTLIEILTKSTIISPDDNLLRVIPAGVKLMGTWRLIASLRYPQNVLELIQYGNGIRLAVILNKSQLDEVPNGFFKDIIQVSSEVALNNEYVLLLTPPITSIIRPKSQIVLVYKKPSEFLSLLVSALMPLNITYTLAHLYEVKEHLNANTIILPSEAAALSLLDMSMANKNILILNFDGYRSIIRRYIANDTEIIFKAGHANEFIVNGTLIYKNHTFILPLRTTTWIIKSVITDDPKALIVLNDVKSYGWSVERVDVGNYTMWQLIIPKRINSTKYDYLTLYWNGRNSGKYVTVEINTETGSIYYQFKDTWYGWKKIYLFSYERNGKYTFNNVTITKMTDGKPDLARVTAVRIRNIVSKGVWEIEKALPIKRVAFEKRPSLTVFFRTERKDVKQILMIVCEGKECNRILTTNMTMSLRIPITPGRTIRLTMIPITKSSSPKIPIKVLGHTKNITVPSTPTIDPHIVMSYLDPEKEVPLLIRMNEKTYYVNIYPIYYAYVQGMIKKEEAVSIISYIMKKILYEFHLSYYVMHKMRSIAQSHVCEFVAENIEAEGDIIITPHNGVIYLVNEEVTLMNVKEVHCTSLQILKGLGKCALVKTKNTIIVDRSGNTHKIRNATLVIPTSDLEISGSLKISGLCGVSDWHEIVNKDLKIQGHVMIRLKAFDENLLEMDVYSRDFDRALGIYYDVFKCDIIPSALLALALLSAIMELFVFEIHVAKESID